MTTTNDATHRFEDDNEFEPPRLTLIGPAAEIVRGLPGGGFDGPYGMTEPDFEFQPDDNN